MYLALGALDEAVALYRRLVLCPLLVRAPLEGHDADHCLLMPSRLVSVLLQVRAGRVVRVRVRVRGGVGVGLGLGVKV